ncbi:MAG TPA: hypothetical protein VFT91_04115, partial [Dehalococcoidia bacterium]|nr:hypothetical protein [Dehalococcoidia bacterium]
MAGKLESLEIGYEVHLQDAAQLPPGCWVDEQGVLYKAEDSKSLTEVLCRQGRRFILVGEVNRTP